jgi:hypothetical protein
MFNVTKIRPKKVSFCLPVPSENLVQSLPESGSGFVLDPDPHLCIMLDPDPYPHTINADPKHCQDQSKSKSNPDMCHMEMFATCIYSLINSPFWHV